MLVVLDIQKFLKDKIDNEGYSINGLARDIGDNISAATISRIVRGDVTPSLDTIVRIYNHFGMNIYVGNATNETPCRACGYTQMVPSGSCMVCAVCGETTGCS